jgi:uncharacterized RDD family membrane protein YckC
MNSLVLTEAPKLRRRMACVVYELLMLFGVSLLPAALGAVFFKLTEQGHPLQSPIALRVFAFMVYGAYFTWCWSKTGQTLPMQTWNIKVVTADGQSLTQKRALLRFLLGWMWFAPGAIICWLFDLSGRSALMAAAAGGLIYATSSLLRRDGQFWHDVLAGTRLITFRHLPKQERPA